MVLTPVTGGGAEVKERCAKLEDTVPKSGSHAAWNELNVHQITVSTIIIIFAQDVQASDRRSN